MTHTKRKCTEKHTNEYKFNTEYALSENCYNLKLKSTGALDFNLQIHPPLQRCLKRGCPDVLTS